MSEKVTDKAPAPSVPAEVWEARKRNNVRLAWVFGGFAVLLFAMALWKLRPL